jgi:hypothetical protein
MQPERKTLQPRSAFRSLIDGGGRFARREPYELPLSGPIPDASTYSFNGPREARTSEGLTKPRCYLAWHHALYQSARALTS